MKKSLDILLTSYRQPEYLDECLRSVAAQTSQDFNLYIVDDDPTHSVQHVIDHWLAKGMQLTFIQNDSNIGGLRSLDKLYHCSSAEFFMWLHHDDVLAPDFIEQLLQRGLRQHPQCSFGYGLYRRKRAQGSSNDTGVYRPDFQTGIHEVLYQLCITSWIIPSFSIIRRKAFDEVGGFARHLTRVSIQEGRPRAGYIDHYMFARLATRGPAYVHNQALGDYRVHSENSSALVVQEMRRTAESIRTLDYLFDDHNLFPPVARYLSKANVMGRMLTNMGVISAVLQMLQSNELGPEIRPLTKELLQATSEALSSLIYDEEQLGRPLVTPVQHLQELQKLISTIN